MNPTIEVFNHNGTLCYRVNGGIVNYHHRFPMDWALNHTPSMEWPLDHSYSMNNWKGYQTGPEVCGNCRLAGSIGDVFIGYCANCALYCHGLERGIGLVNDNGTETMFDQVIIEVNNLTKIQKEQEFESRSIYKGYMKGIDINELIKKHHSESVILETFRDLLLTSQQSQDDFIPIDDTFFHRYTPVGITRATCDGTDIEQYFVEEHEDMSCYDYDIDYNNIDDEAIDGVDMMM